MSDYLKALPNFRNLHIAVIGDVMLDRYIYGHTRRKNPESNARLFTRTGSESETLGGAANVANNLASLNSKVTLFGNEGDDRHYERFMRLIEDSNINFIGVPMNSDGLPTIVKQRFIDEDTGECVFRDDSGEHIQRIFELKYQDLFLKTLKGHSYDAYLLSDYNKGLLASPLVQEIIRTAREAGKLVVVDPKPRNIENFQNSTLISPNIEEALEIAKLEMEQGETYTSSAFQTRLGRRLKEIVLADFITVTLREHGAFSYDGTLHYVPAISDGKVDVIGAGDTFIATLTLALLSNLDIHNAANLANHAAGLVVEKRGTATVTLEELATAINEKKPI